MIDKKNQLLKNLGLIVRAFLAISFFAFITTSKIAESHLVTLTIISYTFVAGVILSILSIAISRNTIKPRRTLILQAFLFALIYFTFVILIDYPLFIDEYRKDALGFENRSFVVLITFLMGLFLVYLRALIKITKFN